jgi:hypothetical protein
LPFRWKRTISDVPASRSLKLDSAMVNAKRNWIQGEPVSLGANDLGHRRQRVAETRFSGGTGSAANWFRLAEMTSGIAAWRPLAAPFVIV